MAKGHADIARNGKDIAMKEGSKGTKRVKRMDESGDGRWWERRFFCQSGIYPLTSESWPVN
jgi:hypothetical protein